ncbi:MAG: TIGR02099 family protein [Proteobacteria bacterium]|nr:TIGR02099 family protein [Pseudomonadota bacterium]
MSISTKHAGLKPRHFFVLFRFLRFLKYILIAAGVLIAVFIASLLVIRFVLLPQWEAQPQKVADFFGERIGLPVTLGNLQTGWDGWNPQLTVHDLQIYAASGEAAGATAPASAAQLTLPNVGLQVDAWNSLLHLDVRFKRLRLEQPALIVRRDAAGQVFIGGVLLAASPEEKNADNSPFVDWLLRQRTIEIDGGTVEWRDEKRAAPPLIIEQLNFRGERSLTHYRFGLRGDLVSETGATFEVRGDTSIGLLQRSFDHDWGGYLRLDRVDLGSLRQWIDLPVALTRGEGSVQTWVSLSKQRITSITVDLALHDVKANWAPGLAASNATAEPAIAPLELQEARGRFTGREERNRSVFSTDGLTLVEKSGLRLGPMTATLTLEGLSPETPLRMTESLTQALRGHLEFDRLDVSVLTGLLQFVPLPNGWRQTLAALKPRGVLENGNGRWEFARERNGAEESLRLIHYSARAAVRDASAQAYEAYPGIRGISGTVSFDETRGTVALTGRNVVLDLPRVFPETLSLDTADGHIGWTHKPEGLLVRIDTLHFANADAEGTVQGSWQANGGDGIADLSAQLQRATAAGAYRYIPYVAGEHVRKWLQESLKSGAGDHGQVVLKGDLDRFPFPGGKDGNFSVTAHVANARLLYDPAWPAIDGIDADLRFVNESMTISAKRGSIFDAPLGPTKVVIPDLGAQHPHLRIDGSAGGPVAAYLRFLDESPVGGWLDHMLTGTQATGDGALTLKLDIPLDGEETSKVNGSFKLAGNTLDLPEMPSLTQAQGIVTFTEHDVSADALTFEALGGKGTLTLTSQNGGVVLTGTGTANLSTLHTNASLPLLDRLSGTTPWRLTLNTGGKRGLHWLLTTPLTGVTVDLPAPLGKEAYAVAPLQIMHDTLAATAGKDAPKEEYWRVDYQSPGAPLTVIAKRVPNGTAWKLESALVNIGETKGSSGVVLPPTPGLSVRGALTQLDITPWYALYQTLPRNEKMEGLALSDVDVNIGTLSALGRQLHEVHFSTRQAAGVWGINLASREAEGRLAWEHADAHGTVNGRLKGKFSRLALLETEKPSPRDRRFSNGKGSDEKSGGEQKASTVLIPGSVNPWPEVDFEVDHFFYKEKDLGHLSVQAEPRGPDWHMNSVVLSNPDGVITADGWWRTARQAQRTEVNVTAQVNDAEKFLEHFGVPRSIVASDVRLDGALSWADAPSDFNLGTLDGHLTLNVGRGHFTRIEPGIGRLLGVLSLQALPRRLTLDFRDVFSEGFAFDSIVGSTEINNGILHTSDLLMDGASAKVKLTGTVDLSKETQDLNVYVQPSLTDSLSVGAAGASVLLMANPVSAAAVGIGALIGQIVLGNPFEKIFSYEYTVKGSWDDPTVEKKTREGVQLPPAEALTPERAH